MSRLSGSSVEVMWDPGSIVDDAEVELDVTVPGAKLGDMVFVSHEEDTQDLVTSHNVTAPNTVTIVWANVGGTTRNRGNHKVRVLVCPADSFF